MGARILAAIAGLLLSLTVGTTAHAGVPAPERTTYQPSWHKVHFHMNAYSGAPGHGDLHCLGTYSSRVGQCWGYGESGLSAQSYPFERSVSWGWRTYQPFGCNGDQRIDDHWTHYFVLETYNDQQLCGLVDRHWGTLRVTGGKINSNGHLATVHASSGVVADREHVQGGPLFVFLQSRGETGYVLGLRGWLYY